MVNNQGGLPVLRDDKLSEEVIAALQGPACILDFTPEEVAEALAFGEEHKVSFFRDINAILPNLRSWI